MDGLSSGFRQRPWWLLAVALVTIGQAGLALQLFGPEEGFAGLSDPRPVVAGRHPLHLYHGSLGAATFRENYAVSCYDPAFQAGYPKTPVFDGGSRPAELFLTLADGKYNPAAYNRGIFAVCLLAPLAFILSARGFGLSAAGSTIAGVGGCLIWWSPPVRAMLDAGNLDLLLAGLMALVFIGGLARYANEPGPVSWVLLAVVLIVGWFAHPIVWLGLAPVGAAYYLKVAPRYGLAWHLGLVGMAIAGLAPNLWWLWDWTRFWWLRQPSVDDLAPFPAMSVLLGSPENYLALLGPGMLGWVLLIVGVGGLLGMLWNGRRLEVMLLIFTALLAIVVARLGATWPTLQVVGSERAAPFAVAALVIPGAWLLSRWWERTAFGSAAAWVLSSLPFFLGWAAGLTAPITTAFCLNLSPLQQGLSEEQEQLVAGLKEHTTPHGRILIEEFPTPQSGWNWTALLPVLTERNYLGGLDADAGVEHTFCGMKGGKLNGRPFAEWSIGERAEFCRRYNVGWVLCRTPEAVQWWTRDPSVREVGRFRDHGEVVLFAVIRSKSYILTGTATLERADRRRIVLSDVAPNENGEVVLSFHHQPGFRAAPNVVTVDTDKDLFDPIPMIKLKLAGTVSRVTLTWDNP